MTTIKSTNYIMYDDKEQVMKNRPNAITLLNSDGREVLVASVKGRNVTNRKYRHAAVLNLEKSLVKKLSAIDRLRQKLLIKQMTKQLEQ